MNIDRLTRVRELILDHPDNFSMSDFFVIEDEHGDSESICLPEADEDDRLHNLADHPCSTVACIAGWAAVLADPASDYWDINAAIILRLTARQAISLFYARGGFEEGSLYHTWHIPLHKITADHAAAAITSLIETGEVIWPEELDKVEIKLPVPLAMAESTVNLWVSHDASLSR